MTKPPVAAKVKQTLNIHGHFAPEVALNGKRRNFGSHSIHFLDIEILDSYIERNASLFAYPLSRGPTNTINVG
jgi:hypothetical protein